MKIKPYILFLTILIGQICHGQEVWLGPKNLLRELKRLNTTKDVRKVFITTYKPDQWIITGPLLDNSQVKAIDLEIDRLRSAVVKFGIVWDPFRVSPLTDRKQFSRELFQNDNLGAFEDRREAGVVNLFSSEFSNQSISNMPKVVRALQMFDEVIIRTDNRAGRLFLYSPGTRQLVLEKFGIDPIDFFDPLTESVHPNFNRTFSLPIDIKIFLLREVIQRKMDFIASFRNEMKEKKIQVSFFIDQPALVGTLNDRLGGASIWLNELQSPTVPPLYVALDDFDNLSGRVSSFLEALKTKTGTKYSSLRVNLIGTVEQQARLKSLSNDLSLPLRPISRLN